jgi:hypothetical protein
MKKRAMRRWVWWTGTGLFSVFCAWEVMQLILYGYVRDRVLACVLVTGSYLISYWTRPNRNAPKR